MGALVGDISSMDENIAIGELDGAIVRVRDAHNARPPKLGLRLRHAETGSESRDLMAVGGGSKASHILRLLKGTFV